MKAITIYAPYIDAIMKGLKTAEYRSWATKHRGDLLLCSAAKSRGIVWLEPGWIGDVPAPDWYKLDWSELPCGFALCVVNVTGCETTPDGYAWTLADVRPIEPVPVKGSQGFYTVNIKPVYL
jgi:hypothetical protein